MQSLQLLILIKEDGTEIDLLASIDEPLCIHERENITFKIETLSELTPTLQAGDYEISLHRSIKPSIQGNGFFSRPAQVFANFIGTVFFEYIDTESTFSKIRPINIFANKLTYKKALGFLSYLSQRSDVNSVCFSPTRHGGTNTEKDINNITARIDLGIKALDVFWKSRDRFKLDPCASNKSRAEIVEHAPNQQLDDRSIAYLAHNPDQLVRCDPSIRDLTLRGMHYRVNQIQRIKNEKDTDVIENQVIIVFLHNLLRFLEDVMNDLESRQPLGGSSIEVNGEEYISIDRILKESGLVLNMQQEKARNAIEKIKEAIHFVDNYLPCSQSAYAAVPIPSQRVLAKPHYFELYSIITKYYRVGEPDLSGLDMVYGIRNIAKLYELVCLTQILEHFKKAGFECVSSDYRLLDADSSLVKKPINEPNNYYRLEKSGQRLDIWYEPAAVTYGRENITQEIPYSIVDVKSRRDINYKPDFVLVHFLHGDIKAHVLDAKYSSYSVVKSTHLPDVASKYLNYLRIRQGDAYLLPESLNILFSGDYHGYLSSHHNAARIINTQGKVNPGYIKPALGACSFNPENLPMLDKLLTVLFPGAVDLEYRYEKSSQDFIQTAVAV